MKKLGLLILGLILGFCIAKFLFNDNTNIVKPMPIKPPGVISPTQAKTLDTAFNARHQEITRFIGQQDNRSSWWSLKDMRDYLDYVEDEVKKQGYTMDGVRVYLGAYPLDGANANEGLTTMFMVPTGKKSVAEGSMSPVGMQPGSGDIPTGSPLNNGVGGNPPQANYPNN